MLEGLPGKRAVLFDFFCLGGRGLGLDDETFSLYNYSKAYFL